MIKRALGDVNDATCDEELNNVTLAELPREVHAKQKCRVTMVPEKVQEVM